MRISDWSSDVCSSDLVELRHAVTEALAVGGGEKVHRRKDIAEAAARHLDVARLVHAGGDEDGVVAAAQGGEAFGAADVAVEVEDDPAALTQVGTAAHHPLLQLEVGDAVDHPAADPVVAVVDMPLKPLASELTRGGEAP